MGKNGKNERQLYIEDRETPAESSENKFRFFGERLKRIMMIRCVNCNELAAQVYAAPSTITGYRSGRRGPDVAQLTTLARALNVSVDYLLGLKDEPEKLISDD
jgi:transcriptional regulator with XRE-family HTH domain